LHSDGRIVGLAGKCLTVNRRGKNGPVVLETCGPNDVAQKWKLAS
jgi:hypothetical protein